jgi:hypothetical protein
MKSIKFLIRIFFLLLIALNSFSQDYVTLPDAIKDGKVKCSLNVNESGTHYTIQFIMNLENLTKKNVKIIIEPGLLFISEEDPYQNFINTKVEKIEILAFQKEKVEIHSMCIENYDSAPSEKNIYKIGNMSEGSLLELAQLINTNKWYEKAEAQDAVWCIANDENIENIIGPDDSIIKKLHEFVSNAKGVALPTEETLNTYETNYYYTEFSRKVSGYFEYEISKTTNISIAMFDGNNILVRQLYYNENQSSGSYKFDYAFDATVYTDKLYYFKLIENGIVTLELEWDMR